MIDLNEVGAFPSVTPAGLEIRFGLYLPGIRGSDGFDVVVFVIHDGDRFNPAIPPQSFNLAWNAGHALDLWSGAFPITPVAGTNFGKEGEYLYRFQLGWTPPGGTRREITRWFTDPFARETDVGLLSAVTLTSNPVPS